MITHSLSAKQFIKTKLIKGLQSDSNLPAGNQAQIIKPINIMIICRPARFFC